MKGKRDMNLVEFKTKCYELYELNKVKEVKVKKPL